MLCVTSQLGHPNFGVKDSLSAGIAVEAHGCLMLTMMIFEVATIEIMMMILSCEVLIFEVEIYKMMMMMMMPTCEGAVSADSDFDIGRSP